MRFHFATPSWTSRIGLGENQRDIYLNGIVPVGGAKISISDLPLYLGRTQLDGVMPPDGLFSLSAYS